MYCTLGTLASLHPTQELLRDSLGQDHLDLNSLRRKAGLHSLCSLLIRFLLFIILSNLLLD